MTFALFIYQQCCPYNDWWAQYNFLATPYTLVYLYFKRPAWAQRVDNL